MGTPDGKRVQEIFSDDEWAMLARSLDLSPRQTHVLRGLFAGEADKQIARRLGIGQPTVRTHLRRLFRRLDAQDRVELVLRIVSHWRRIIKNDDTNK